MAAGVQVTHSFCPTCFASMAPGRYSVSEASEAGAVGDSPTKRPAPSLRPWRDGLEPATAPLAAAGLITALALVRARRLVARLGRRASSASPIRASTTRAWKKS
jgi:hypothetical protein